MGKITDLRAKRPKLKRNRPKHGQCYEVPLTFSIVDLAAAQTHFDGLNARLNARHELVLVKELDDGTVHALHRYVAKSANWDDIKRRFAFPLGTYDKSHGKTTRLCDCASNARICPWKFQEWSRANA